MDKVVSDKIRYSYFSSAILVMVMHCSGGVVGDGLSIESKFSMLLCKCGVPAVAWFVFMSAYFLFRKRKKFSFEEYLDLLKKRARSLLIPYIVWNIIALLWYRYVYGRIFSEDMFRLMTLRVFLKAFIPFQSANGGLWTVAIFMIFVVLSPMIFYCLRWKYSIFLVMLLELEVIAFSKTASSVIYWFPLYAVGGYMGMHWSERLEGCIAETISKKPGKVYRWIGMASAIALYLIVVTVVCLLFYNLNLQLIGDSILRFLSPVLFFTLTKYVIQPWKLNWYVNNSFLIYVSHGLLINVFGTLVRQKFTIGNMFFRYLVVVFFILIFEGIFLVIMKQVSKCRLMWIVTGGR